MADPNTENKIEQPNLNQVLQSLLEQARTQRRRVRIEEENKEDRNDSERDSHDEEEYSESDSEEPNKWDVLLNLADSQKMLCKAFLELLEISEE